MTQWMKMVRTKTGLNDTMQHQTHLIFSGLYLSDTYTNLTKFSFPEFWLFSQTDTWWSGLMKTTLLRVSSIAILNCHLMVSLCCLAMSPETYLTAFPLALLNRWSFNCKMPKCYRSIYCDNNAHLQTIQYLHRWYWWIDAESSFHISKSSERHIKYCFTR